MFIGHYQSKLDLQKGRVAVPSVFQKKLGKKAIITKGFDNSLLLVSFTDWQQVISAVTQNNFLSGISRQTDRFLLGNAFEVEFDQQGRLVIPKKLREYANLEQEVLFVGVGSRIEIWSSKQWQKQDEYLNQNIAEITEKLDKKLTNQD